MIPYVTLLDLTECTEPDDMEDVSHYYAGLLQRIAGYVDEWYELINPPDLSS